MTLPAVRIPAVLIMYMENRLMAVLFIHDHPGDITVPADLIQKRGRQVLEADGIPQARDYLMVRPVRVIVFALKNRHKDGIGFCRKIRNAQKNRYVYFIMAAGKMDKRDRLEGLKQGIDAYISLPPDPDELEAAVLVALRITASAVSAPRETGIKDGVKKEDDGNDEGFPRRPETGRPPDDGRSVSQIQSDPVDPPADPPDSRTDPPPVGIRVSEDRLEAFLVRRKAGIGSLITVNAVRDLLSDGNIVFGVGDVDAVAAAFNQDTRQERAVSIAKGRAPVMGSDAVVTYYFDLHPLKAGLINPDGSIDYRERGRMPYVRAHDLLATKTPMTEGVAGRDVHNVPIPVPDTQDVPLKCGEGARLSEDGLHVYADIDGQPNLSIDGHISVFAELVIDGDVDFNTGNIDFDGNLTVKGAVLDGFTVRCGHLQAAEIRAAVLVTRGDIVVTGGIYGADIKAEGSVRAKLVADSNIKAFGDVIVEKEVLQTKIRSSGRFLARQAKIISSFISAKMGIEAREIGTDISSPCRIDVGVDENVKKRIQGLAYAMDEKRRGLESAQRRYEHQSKKLAAIHLRIADLVRIRERLLPVHRLADAQIADFRARKRTQEAERMEASLREIEKRLKLADDEMGPLLEDQRLIEGQMSGDMAVIESRIKEIEAVSNEKAAIQKWSEEEKGFPQITVTGQIQQGSRLFGAHSSLTLQESVRNVTVREVFQPDIDIFQMMIVDSQQG